MTDQIGPALLRLILQQAAHDVTRGQAARTIAAFLSAHHAGMEDVRTALSHPLRSWGPFEALPEDARANLAAAASFYLQEASGLTSAVARMLSYGPISALGGALAHLAAKHGDKGDASSRTLLVRIARRLIGSGRQAGLAATTVMRYTPFYRGPFPHLLWTLAGFDPSALIQDYIDGIPLDPRLSPVYESTAGVMSCGLVGIDLLPSRGKLYFLESNFNPGHYPERHRLSPAGDVVCNHLAAWASGKGLRKIVFFPHNYPAVFERSMEEAWQAIGERNGVSIEVVDDPAFASPWHRSRRVLMDPRAAGTLYVNGRHLPGPVARLVSRKGLMEAAIRRFGGTPETTGCLALPALILRDADLRPPDEQSPFPNLIIKRADVDQAKGISLFRTPRLPDHANVWPNIAYDYVPPDLVVTGAHDAGLRYAHIFRAYLLVTPRGPVYLGARKDVSSVPIPASIPLGELQDKSPYVINLHLGAYSVPHSDEEDRRCREAVLAIGSAVHRFLQEKHILIVQ